MLVASLNTNVSGIADVADAAAVAAEAAFGVGAPIMVDKSTQTDIDLVAGQQDLEWEYKITVIAMFLMVTHEFRKFLRGKIVFN